MCLSQPTFKPDSFLSRGKNVNFVIFLQCLLNNGPKMTNTGRVSHLWSVQSYWMNLEAF